MEKEAILTSTEVSKVWGISSRRISLLCSEGRIAGAIKKGKLWLIPSTSEKPVDLRVATNLRQIETSELESKELCIQNRRYLGNKYKLLNFIQQVMTDNCENIHSLLDIFAGTGVVANYFSNNMDIITNDILYSNYISHVAFMSNESVDDAKLASIIEKYNELTVEKIGPNYMSINFGNTYYSESDCKKIGYIRESIENMRKVGELSEREHAILVTSLLYSIDKIANTCGHYDAYLRNGCFDKMFKMKLIKYQKGHTFKRSFYNGDANILAKEGVFPRVDLVYCDPPYNSRNYSDLYHLLENIAAWKKPEVKGVAKKMDRTALKSAYCSRKAGLAFQDLVNNLDCRYILLSYNNTGKKADDRSNARISDEEIMSILSSRGRVKTFTTNYKAFSTGKSHNDTNEERLFLCEVQK